MLQTGGIFISENKYRTQKGYALNRADRFSCVMEDYIEMIYRQSSKKGYAKTGEIAEALNVNASSATKMICKLKSLGLVDGEKYGIIQLTENGKKKGEFLYKRHNIIYSFFSKLTGEDVALEKIFVLLMYYQKIYIL